MAALTTDKREAIKASINATKAKRKQQQCLVRILKIQTNKLTRVQKEALEGAFREAKWLRNHIVGLPSLKDYRPAATVPVKLPNGTFEERHFKYLGSQIRQSVAQQVWRDAVNLAIKKQKGRKVGRLKFKSQVNSLDLKQVGITYRIANGKLSIQKMPGQYRLLGVAQLKNLELANAKLLRRPDGYYLAVTTFQNKDEVIDDFQPGTAIGLDMGIRTHITLSDGSEVNVLVGETKRLRFLQRRLSRQVRGSNRYYATRRAIQKEYQKMNNRKNEAANKTVSQLLKNELVFMQNEQLASWKKRNGYVRAGKRLQHSILGRVKVKLSRHERVVVLPRNVATTQLCICGIKNKHQLSERTYFCSSCGYGEARDTHAALNMIRLGLKTKAAALEQSKELVERLSDFNSEELMQGAVKREAFGAMILPLTRTLPGEASGSSAQM